jgi:type III secretory pathway component EscR
MVICLKVNPPSPRVCVVALSLPLKLLLYKRLCNWHAFFQSLLGCVVALSLPLKLLLYKRLCNWHAFFQCIHFKFSIVAQC